MTNNNDLNELTLKQILYTIFSIILILVVCFFLKQLNGFDMYSYEKNLNKHDYLNDNKPLIISE